MTTTTIVKGCVCCKDGSHEHSTHRKRHELYTMRGTGTQECRNCGFVSL